MRALSIRQPFAELILRGIKTVEYRSRATRIIGERFWIYASLKRWSGVGGRWSVRSADNIVVPSESPPEWMLELAAQVRLIEPDLVKNGTLLPTGVIVGSARIVSCSEVITNCRSGFGFDKLTAGGDRKSSISFRPTTYAWHLGDVQRATKLRKPSSHPQPVWFNPF